MVTAWVLQCSAIPPGRTQSKTSTGVSVTESSLSSEMVCITDIHCCGMPVDPGGGCRKDVIAEVRVLIDAARRARLVCRRRRLRFYLRSIKIDRGTSGQFDAERNRCRACLSRAACRQ